MARQETVNVHVRMDINLKRLVDEVAEKEGRAVSEIWREALIEWLERRAYLNALTEDEVRGFINTMRGYSNSKGGDLRWLEEEREQGSHYQRRS